MTHRIIFGLMLWLLACGSFSPLAAQVSDDFEGGTLNGWFSEGDGDFSLSNAQGNPGSSLVVDDDATGSINYAVAPVRYLGDWSNALTTDSLVLDIYVESSDPDTISGALPGFELVGPGGRATAFDGLDLPRNQWNRVGIPLDSAQWNVSQGTWTGLLDGISLLRIRAEYITGNENVYFDNIRLDVQPIRGAIRDTICSDFEDGTVDGWRFEEAGSINVNMNSGNPGLGLSVGDDGGVISQAIAPPKFWGDWTALTDSGKLQFDLWIDQSSNNLYEKDYLVQLTGNGAVATVLPPDSILENALGQWYTFSFFIDSAEWTMQSGDWDSLLVNVSELRLELEFITGGEVARLDNICLLPGPQQNTSAQEAPTGGWSVFPNPALERITVRWQAAHGQPATQLAIIDAQGRTVLHRELQTSPTASYSIRDLSPGIYFVRFATADQQWTQRLMVR